MAAAVLGTLWQVLFNSVFVQMLPPDYSGSLGLTIDLPFGILAGSSLIVFVLLSYLTIVATRTFVAGKTTQLPTEFLQRQIPWVIANLIVGGIVFTLLLFIGSLLFVIPGLVAYLSLLFMTFFIAVDDDNFISAMTSSWHLTRGNWIRLFILLAIIIVPTAVGSALVSTASVMAFGANSAASQIATGLISLPVSILILGVLAETFVQLQERHHETSPGSATTDRSTPEY
ncbi:hypothetical protein GCM10008995_26400 [Halobellus salinus]|uniref:DUF7847 domain-containing protein n=2 Tax=Halobellus salinus TaxID=931585 RepID=A0A830EE08_9EURY|nr:hypothetical protein GCM10008995_26400 [Halobellus salinus]